MRHRASPRYWAAYRALPPEVQQLAAKSFALLKSNPHHPSLHFKKIGQLWSVRVGLHHRAVAKQRDYGALWFWIGPHEEYDRLIG